MLTCCRKKNYGECGSKMRQNDWCSLGRIWWGWERLAPRVQCFYVEEGRQLRWVSRRVGIHSGSFPTVYTGCCISLLPPASFSGSLTTCWLQRLVFCRWRECEEGAKHSGWLGVSSVNQTDPIQSFLAISEEEGEWLAQAKWFPARDEGGLLVSRTLLLPTDLLTHTQQ